MPAPPAQPAAIAAPPSPPGLGLRRRDRRPELMDDPALDPAAHRHALAGLKWLNWLSTSASAVWPAVRRLAAAQPGRPIRLLDVASGGGDVLLALVRKARRAGIALEADGCDVSADAVAAATEAAERAGLPAKFFTTDVLRDPLPNGYDAAVCSTFLHHLDAPDAVRLLAGMRQAAPRLVVVNDLARSALNYGLVWVACRAVSRSHVVRSDGPVSVRAAFTPAELLTLAEEAGLTGAAVRLRFPGRMVLEWRGKP